MIHHPFSCVCDICMPSAPAQSSPTVQSAQAAGRRPDPGQVQMLFESLDAYGQSMVWAMLTCAVRLQGKRG